MEQLLPFNNVATEIETPVAGEAHHFRPRVQQDWQTVELQQVLHNPAPFCTAPAQDLQESAASLLGLHPHGGSRWPWAGIALVHTPEEQGQAARSASPALPCSAAPWIVLSGLRPRAFVDFTPTTSPRFVRPPRLPLPVLSPGLPCVFTQRKRARKTF